MPPHRTIADQVGTEKAKAENAKTSTHSLSDDSIQVDKFIYDAKSLASVHPGGELFVKAFAGRDATEAFLSYHRRQFPHANMTSSLVGTVAKANKDERADDEYLELCNIVEKVLPRNKSFAPFSYYFKVVLLLGSAVGLEMYMHMTGRYKWYLCGILGWLFALIGLNIQHDANHGAVSRSSVVNRILGMTQNWIGGSALDWIHQHVVQHHIHCNDEELDPDIVGNPVLRFNPLSPLAKVNGFQYIYMFVLLALFGFTYIADSITHILTGFHKTKFSKLIDNYRNFEALTTAVFIIRLVVVPLIRYPSLNTLLSIAPTFIVGGYYLSFFFVISHNFEGVHMFTHDYAKNDNTSFLRKQVASSSNVGGAFLCALNGGLNYQIEHHLFPRMQHTHYPVVAPVVRKFCEERGIPYVHFPTVWENVVSCSRHMYQMGTRPTPENYHYSGRKKE